MLNLILDRPIVFFDLETTGVSTDYAKIVQIAIIKIMPDGEIIKKCRLINPLIEIPQGAIDVHGITNEAVANESPFQHIAKSLIDLFDGCDIGGFNSRVFDLPLLRNEFKRCDIEYNYLDYDNIDVYVFEKYLRKKEGNPLRNKSKLVDLYKHYTGKSLDDAHDALVDVLATIDVFNKQIIKYIALKLVLLDEIMPKGDSYAVKNSKILLVEGKHIWNFGKHKGKAITIDYNYGKWFYNTETFSIDERKIVGQKLKII
jgi:DNA polymerase-3 subunit epsilon